MTLARPGDAPTLDRIYAQRFSADDPARLAWRRELWRVLVEGFFSRWIPPEATVLDYGCGRGELLDAVVARRRIGADLRAGVREHLAPGIELVVVDGARLDGIDDGTVDVVFCSNVLEHLPDRQTVTRLFEEIRRVLKPDGRLLVLGPNLRYTGQRYWDFFDHTLPLTHLSLVEAFVTGGLVPELVIPRFLPYTTVGARLTPLWLVRLYLRLPIAWRFFGEQFFAVARPAPGPG